MASGLLAEDCLAQLVDTFDEMTGDVEKVLMSDAVLVKRLVSQVRERWTSAASNYNRSLKAFFEYLNLRGSSACSTHRRDTVDVTLRVLRILSCRRNQDVADADFNRIVSHGMERTPSDAWRSITPQLLSLMQHGRPWLRTLMSKLLRRLASEWSQLLVFPVAVGAAGLAWSWSTEYPAGPSFRPFPRPICLNFFLSF